MMGGLDAHGLLRVGVLALAWAVGCGGAPATPRTTQPVRAHARTATDRILPLLPDGAQLIIEVDLARLRANPVVGALVTSALTGEGLPPLPVEVPVSPLAHADAVVLASYGVGTAQAATVTVLATTHPVAGATPLADGLVALGPPAWIAQLEARAAVAGLGAAPEVTTTTEVVAAAPDPAGALVAAADLLALRDHAMPEAAPGASLRVTARLPFDARVALARQTGLDAPPAQVSIWADVVDDLAIVIDADAADPGDRGAKHPARRLEAGMRGLLAALAEDPTLRALGISRSLASAKLVVRGTWLRTIIAIGPARLRRVVERANASLHAPVTAPATAPANAPAHRDPP